MTRLQQEMQRMADDNQRIEELEEENARLRAALKPFAAFAQMFDATPMKGGADALYSIHGGAGAPSGKGAEIRLSDCRAALKALEGT